jgi:hypothetical protein
MDQLRPLLEAGLVEKVGSKKTGRYTLRNTPDLETNHQRSARNG